MHKVKAKVIFKNSIRSPSPDQHTAHKVPTTNSPIPFIKPQIKTPLLNPYQYIQELETKIALLEQELQHSQDYSKQLKQLSQKNKRLEEQMKLLLHELQKQHQSHSYDYLQNSSQKPQYQVLKENILELDQIVSQMGQKYQKLEGSLKNALKKDLNIVEHRIMDYLFKLQNKIASLQTINLSHSIRQQEEEREKTQKIQKPLVKESLISMMNLQISSSSNHLKTLKKQIRPECIRCLQYEAQIQNLKVKLQELNIRKSAETENMIEKINSMESNLHIMIDSSAGEGSRESEAMDSIDFNLKSFLQELNSKLRSIKQEMKMFMDGSSSAEYLQKELIVKDVKIAQLQSQTQKLVFEVQEKQREIEKLQKLLRFQVNRYEDEKRVKENPAMISCVNHKETKSKLKHILSAMKNLEDEWQSKFSQ